MTKVSNMTNSKGNKVANQFILEDGSKQILQSYNTVIAVKDITIKGVQITLDINSWDYSVTTGKYRNLFLGETKAETEKKIKNGIYKLVDLN